MLAPSDCATLLTLLACTSFDPKRNSAITIRQNHKNVANIKQALLVQVLLVSPCSINKQAMYSAWLCGLKTLYFIIILYVCVTEKIQSNLF